MVLPRSIHTQSYNEGKDGSPTKAYLMSQRTKCDFFFLIFIYTILQFSFILFILFFICSL